MTKLPIVALFAIGTCTETIELPDAEGVSSFSVRLRDGEPGTAEAPLPFSGQNTFTIDVVAIGRNGEPTEAFDGEVSLAVNPAGALAKGQPTRIRLENGRAEGVQVSLEKVHGRVHIWVEDKGDEGAPGTYATGLSPAITVAHPTIRNLQETQKHRISPLAGDFVELDLEGREVVVTAVTNDGFYATDKTEPKWGGVFVFTHSRPRGLEGGEKLVALSGTAEDFFGFTELAFPSWKAEGKLELPAPVVIDPTIVADDLEMESYEGGLVELHDVIVCPPTEDFFTFGQWTVLVDTERGNCGTGAGAVTILSAFTVDWFDPQEHAGDRVRRITGNLRYHQSATPGWILRPRDGNDFEL